MTTPVPSMSLVINTRNEGPDVGETIKSMRASFTGEMEAIVIADGTTDGSCDGLGTDVQVLYVQDAIGCGKAKQMGTRKAKNDVICHGDGHHRVIKGSLDDMAKLAVAEQAIVCPCLPPLRCAPDEQIGDADRHIKHESYGAALLVNMLPKVDPYGRAPKAAITRTPGASFAFFMYPQAVLKRLGGWNEYPGNWGSQEIGLSLRAWFADVPVYCMRDVAVGHRFRSWHSGKNPYSKSYSTPRWQSKVNTHYANKVVFDAATLKNIWGPRLPQDKRVDAALEDSALAEQHEEFQKLKVRSDTEFFETFAPNLLEPLLPLDDITVLLLSWKRPTTAQRCVDSLRKAGLRNIWVWCQENIEAPEGASEVISSSANLGTWPRYAISSLVKTPYVLFCDDDTEVRVAGLDALRAGAMQFPGRNLGLFGMRFKPPFTSYHKRHYFKAHDIDEATEVDMLWPKGQLIPTALVRRVFGSLDIWDTMREAVTTNTGDDFVSAVAQQLIGEGPSIVVSARHKAFHEMRDPAPKFALNRYPKGRYRKKAGTFREWRKRGWRPLGVDDWEKGMDAARRLKMQAETSAIMKQNPEEMALAYETIRTVRPSIFLEIGSKYGGSLYTYAGACEFGAHLICVDLGKRQRPRIHLKRTIKRLEKEGFTVIWIRGESRAEKTLRAVEEALAGRKVDALHIDADHHYDAVKADYGNYAPLVREGGAILLHDVDAPRHGTFKLWEELKAAEVTAALYRAERPRKRMGIGYIRKGG